MTLDPARTVAELEELHALSPGGRTAWTPEWERARDWLTEKASGTGAVMEVDPAGNQWFTLGGRSARTLVLGGHLDAAPGAGPLDGPLGLLAGLEVLRRLDADVERRATVKLVGWADSEGERFGRSLLGSTFACWASREPMDVAVLADRDGVPFTDVSAAHGVDVVAASKLARHQLRTAAACLELVTAPAGEPGERLAVAAGTVGVERCRVTWRGQAAHAGSTPMAERRDALAGAARLELLLREIAAEAGESALCTCGDIACEPGIVTSVVETAVQLVDQRHAVAETVERMLERALDASDEIATEERLEATWERLWRIDPVRFDETLAALAAEAVREAGGAPRHVAWSSPSDVSELARAGVPSALLVLPRPHGAPLDGGGRAQAEQAVRALDSLAAATLSEIDCEH